MKNIYIFITFFLLFIFHFCIKLRHKIKIKIKINKVINNHQLHNSHHCKPQQFISMTSTPILSITNTSQLAEYCAVIVPCIWTGSFKSHQPLLNPKRHTAFKLFVQKILKATQISCTCIILALYYIQQLRSAYPSIRASIGSEVRLFTTALVLASKYLDDNTFTNKVIYHCQHT
jgi:hypothetical protein